MDELSHNFFHLYSICTHHYTYKRILRLSFDIYVHSHLALLRHTDGLKNERLMVRVSTLFVLLLDQ